MSKELGLNKYNKSNLTILNWTFIILTGILCLLVLYISLITTGTPLFLGLFAFSSLIIYLLLFKPKIWLYSTFLLTAIFTSTTGGGVDTIDFIFIIYFNIFLYIWILWQIFIKKQKLIESKTEWLLISFYILTLFTVINVVEDNTTFFNWIREYALLTLILYYFPLKKYFNTHKDIIRILIIFGITLLFIDLFQFYIYKQILSNITYAYQAGSSVRNNLYMFVVGSTVSCIFIFYQKKNIYRLLLSILFILTLGALASTFARVFWATAFLNIGIVFLLLNFKEKLKFITYLIISFSVAYLIASIFFGDIFKFILFALETRFQSTSKGTTDISALSRIEEWKIVIEKIKQSPFIGNGFGNVFTFKNPITDFMNYSSIIHNSFLHFAYRIGIPLTIMFFSVFIVNLAKSIYYSIKIRKDLFYKVLMISVSLSFICLFITGMFTMTFILRDALIINATFFFFVNYVEVNYKNKLIN